MHSTDVAYQEGMSVSEKARIATSGRRSMEYSARNMAVETRKCAWIMCIKTSLNNEGFYNDGVIISVTDSAKHKLREDRPEAIYSCIVHDPSVR